MRLGIQANVPRFPNLSLGAAWQLLPTSQRWPAERGDWQRLHSLWQRIWQPQTEIPLPAWAAELRRLQTQTPRQLDTRSGAN